MRGARAVRGGDGPAGGIIPADAGSTWPRWPRPRRTRDHPRGCGEHWQSSSKGIYSVGSSPRMRGALSPCVSGCSARGIIPADAGSTYTAKEAHVVIRDHPRGCGEHYHPQSAGLSVPGSSPRMRGALKGDNSDHWKKRIIPADAGSTPMGSPARR